MWRLTMVNISISPIRIYFTSAVAEMNEIDLMTLLCKDDRSMEKCPVCSCTERGDAEAVPTKPLANLTGSLVIFSNEKQNREDDTGVH